METIEKPITNEPVAENLPVKTPPGHKNVFLVFGVFFLFIVISLLLIVLFTSPKANTGSVQPSSTPNSEATSGAKRKPSSLAADLTFVQLESDLKNLEQDLTNADLTEPKLTMPILEMNVSF